MKTLNLEPRDQNNTREANTLASSNLERRTGKGRLRLGLCFLLSAFCFLPAGCSTTGGSAAGVTTMAITAKSAAFVGTTVFLQKNPDARASFVEAHAAVKGLIAAGTFNASELTAALSALPIKELKGDAGTLIVAEAIVLWDEYGKRLAALDSGKAFETYVLPVAKAIESGLAMALGDN